MSLEKRFATWSDWRNKIGSLGPYIEGVLNEDPWWHNTLGVDTGLNPDKIYDSRTYDWNLFTTSEISGALIRAGMEFRGIFFPLRDGYRPGELTEIFTLKPEGFAIIDSGPKSVEDILNKTLLPEVDNISQIYDFLRVTIVAGNRTECEKALKFIINSSNEYNSFAPLSDEELTLTNSRVIPSVTNFGNTQSAPELLEMVTSGHHFAKTYRMQIGPNRIGKLHYRFDTDPSRLRDSPPPGFRVSVSVMEPQVAELILDPSSPASHQKYVQNRGRF